MPFEEITAVLSNHIDKHGAFEITCPGGLLICETAPVLVEFTADWCGRAAGSRPS